MVSKSQIISSIRLHPYKSHMHTYILEKPEHADRSGTSESFSFFESFAKREDGVRSILGINLLQKNRKLHKKYWHNTEYI